MSFTFFFPTLRRVIKLYCLQFVVFNSAYYEDNSWQYTTSLSGFCRRYTENSRPWLHTCPGAGQVISGGNFHGQPLAISYDFLGIALAELGNISERRIAQLIMGLRGLPEFLVANPGLNSGFMIPQYAAASMVSQNKMYCYAASSDSIVSSNGQEDHVSMGANAATKLYRIMDNLEHILAIELMNAAQGIDFRRPAKTSPVLERFLHEYRKEVPFVKEDIVMYKEIHKTVAFLNRTKFDY